MFQLHRRPRRTRDADDPIIAGLARRLGAPFIASISKIVEAGCCYCRLVGSAAHQARARSGSRSQQTDPWLLPMSEYLFVEKPFLNHLSSLGWEVIDQGVNVTSGDPAASPRDRSW